MSHFLYVLFMIFACFIFWIPHTSDDIQYLSFCHLIYVTNHNTLQARSCCCKWQYSIPFLWLSSVLFSLSSHLLMDLICFPVFPIVDSAANIELYVYELVFLFSLDIFSQDCGTVGSYDSCIFSCLFFRKLHTAHHIMATNLYPHQ